MTRSDARPATIDYALLATGAPFSGHVLRALRQRGHPPRLVVLPEYPPTAEAIAGIEIETGSRGDFLELARDCVLDYAPRTGQARCAARLAALRIDYLLVACWPYLIGAELIGAARKAALNLHPSLLPAWRGADPLAAQLAAGDAHFGVTLHLLDARFDRGDIVAQDTIAAPPGDAGRAALERLCAERGVELFITAAASYARGWSPRAQNP